MVSKIPISRKVLALLSILIGGVIAMWVASGTKPEGIMVSAFAVAVGGGIFITQPRQPYAVVYEPRSFATRVLKWMSAPQIEAAILLWLGIALLIRPDDPRLGIVLYGFPEVMGWFFLFLGWVLLSHLPTPWEYTLIASTRMCFSLVIVLDGLRRGVPLITVGAFAGSILHGVIAMALHWTLAEVAEQVKHLQKEVQQVQNML